jgi:hypothetical protein
MPTARLKHLETSGLENLSVTVCCRTYQLYGKQYPVYMDSTNTTAA